LLKVAVIADSLSLGGIMHRSRCAALAAVACIGFASVASAADLPMQAPPVMAPYNWTGFYAGANAGYSWGSGNSNYTDPGFAQIGLPTSFSGSQNIDGFFGGGQIGFNWQADRTWVFGLEADLQASGETGSSAFGNPSTIYGSFDTEISWFGTVRGRIGALVTPTILMYGTGGLAYGSIKVSGMITDTTVPMSWSFGSNSITKIGWTLGAGIEGAIPVSDWTWKVEYLYIDLGSVSGTGQEADFSTTYTWSAKVTDNIVRVGLNYRFH
jgi:outer membrane immunogenic protein